ncbi:MAG: glutamine--tRNA ligase/YqeY domain fusion protein [Planctomycetota bacterium]
MSEEKSKNFIEEIIDADNASGRFDNKVHTRFPPEPNGYIHIGHAKSICLNYGLAAQYGGTFNLRFDDTNPEKEEQEYVDSIKEDVKWLGADYRDSPLFASNYFQEMYDYAVVLINKGMAYVDSQTAEEISENRGKAKVVNGKTITPAGINSPYRDRPAAENLELFEKMKNGEFKEGEHVLRAKIDMAHPNLNMRDPIMYRISHEEHHNTGKDWCIYPMYDWAHGIEDSLEGITHSICTLEFENHRPLYDWFLDAIEIHHPQQIEFAKLNITYTVLSKRNLLAMFEEGLVKGWDDPRMPTVRALRRRGFSPEAIRNFCTQIGVAKTESTIDIQMLEHCLREDLNKTSNRIMGVLDPLKVVIENFEEGTEDLLDGINNPGDESAGTRKVPFSKVLYIEKADFMEDPPRKFFRLGPGREVRFRYAYFITCNEVIKDENGEVVELRCTYDPETRGGDAPDGRKVKGTIHWVSAEHAVKAEVRLYDRLFTEERPGKKSGDWHTDLNPESLTVMEECYIEPSIKDAPAGTRYQLERTGYFCVDTDSTPEKLVLNRTVSLKDSWAKQQKNKK